MNIWKTMWRCTMLTVGDTLSFNGVVGTQRYVHAIVKCMMFIREFFTWNSVFSHCQFCYFSNIIFWSLQTMQTARPLMMLAILILPDFQTFSMKDSVPIIKSPSSVLYQILLANPGSGFRVFGECVRALLQQMFTHTNRVFVKWHNPS